MRRTAQLLRSLLSILLTTAGESIQFVWLAVSSRAELSAEVLFLRKQLAFYREHQVPPRKLTDAARFSLALWSQLFNWRAALMIVQPETLIGWHRQGFKLFWRRKSRLGRPRIPENLRQLIVRMVQENPTWGEERIAAELSVKLGILVSPRTVRAYWPQERDPRNGRRTSSQHWRTFVRNHAKVIVASDFWWRSRPDSACCMCSC
jgi:putative transposase